ncbi:MAG: prohibitin family protein [Nevskiaceae bacterium]|nr:MAG: prohibitin family protein [Nevskiaceae bacterium]TBR74036.1 MAG: prohibitin family protein [Nevskiaceae bacterium]
MNNRLSGFKGGNFTTVAIGVAVALAFVAGSGAFYTVDAGQRGVLLTWGKVTSDTVQPGLHFKLPFAQTVEKVNVRVMKYESKETAATVDLQDVATVMTVNYSIDPDHVDALYRTVGSEENLVHKLLAPVVSNSLKAVTAEYKAETLVEFRNEVRRKAQQQIVEGMKAYPVTITDMNLTNFTFSGDYARAIEAKQVAQQKALQAKYELEKVETDAQQDIVRAKAQSEATIIAAKAEAEALRLKQKEVTPELIMLDAVGKWDGKLPETMLSDTGGSGNAILPMFKVGR